MAAAAAFVTNAYGVSGEMGSGFGGSGVTNAFGVYGVATTTGTNRYGVYGDGGAYVGANPYWAGFFNGKAFCTLGVWSSDRQLKKNIEPIVGSLSLISRLKPSRYQFDQTVHPGLHLPGGDQIGLIAQEVEEVLPMLVETVHNPDQMDHDGKLIEAGFDHKGLNYLGLLPVVIGGIQEQQAIIEGQREDINSLKADVAELKALLASANGSTASMELPKARLEQNAPNPFSENTTIRFYVPVTARQASIEVNTTDGKTWKTFSALTGQGQLVISAGSMSEGSYTYSLTVDGERIDTRAMVITR